MKEVIGGVCAPKGFRAGGIWCGIRKNKTKFDLAMIVSDTMCTAAGVYTKNKVKGAPIVVTKNHLADGYAQAVICNSGNANTCAPNGLEIAEETCALTAKALGLLPTDIIVASTGVIGKEMEIGPFATGIPQLADAITYEGSQAAAHAIMTTDTKLKEVAVEFTVGGKTCHMGAIAKGSGMIHPNMATMLCFITTDAAISAPMLQKALQEPITAMLGQFCKERCQRTEKSADYFSQKQHQIEKNPAPVDGQKAIGNGRSQACPVDSLHPGSQRLQRPNDERASVPEGLHPIHIVDGSHGGCGQAGTKCRKIETAHESMQNLKHCTDFVGNKPPQ